jgi:hypothetical protein
MGSAANANTIVLIAGTSSTEVIVRTVVFVFIVLALFAIDECGIVCQLIDERARAIWTTAPRLCSA